MHVYNNNPADVDCKIQVSHVGNVACVVVFVMSSSFPNIHRALARVIPELSVTAYKGQAGKLGVCGGSQKYAG